MKELVTDLKYLVNVCSPIKDIDEGIRIGRDLLKFLKTTDSGVGLAANQVGIDARVCVINVHRPVILVNPVIQNSFKKIFFQEACLSFPGEVITTQRYANIQVKCDNQSHDLFFAENNLLETVCVQHEIDHLNGITMHKRQIELDKIDDKSYYRNIKEL